MAKSNENVQIESINRLHDLRKELDPKIEKKVSRETFFWVLGTLTIITCAVFGYIVVQVNMANEKIADFSTRIAVIESKLNIHNK